MCKPGKGSPTQIDAGTLHLGKSAPNHSGKGLDPPKIQQIPPKLNLQSLEDTQVRYILHSYSLDEYTLEKYTLEKLTFSYTL